MTLSFSGDTELAAIHAAEYPRFSDAEIARRRAALYRVLSQREDNEDLAELVRSAARPGLKARIAQYLG